MRKVGERVLVEVGGNWLRRCIPGTVTKVTPSGMFTVMVDAWPPYGTISHSIDFNRNGRRRGNHRGELVLDFDQSVLDEQTAREREDKLRKFLDESILWRKKLSIETVVKVYEIVKADLKSQEKDRG